MKIAVCVKRVPDMEARFKIATDGKSIDTAGLKFDINDFDAWAVEAALQLREKAGAGEVTIISLGPDAVQETIRKALSMGADSGIQLVAEDVPADGFAIAAAIAAELEGGSYDMVLFGKQAPDSANGVVGTMVAELLGYACVSALNKLEVNGGSGRAERAVEGGTEVIEFQLPAVLTVDEGLNQARYPNLKGIMAAKKKPIEKKPAQLGEVTVTVASMEMPPERAPGRIIGEGPDAVPELVKLLQTEAKVL